MKKSEAKTGLETVLKYHQERVDHWYTSVEAKQHHVEMVKFLTQLLKDLGK